MSNVLHYNEQKLEEKVAELIHAENFAKDTRRLTFSDKIKTLQKLTSLNQRTKLNAVHISLNFAPSEKLSAAQLSAIADRYMTGIGFGEQPYLVYQHFDSGHPHIHIVSTNIQADSKRIKMQNIGRNQSETVRKLIEKQFKLKVAGHNGQRQAYEIRPVSAQKVQYGKSATKRAITNVLDYVLPNYRFTSIAELNAVLSRYNVMADTGRQGSRIQRNKGLVYRVLNSKGEKMGVPIKASAFYNRPTLAYLDQKFMANQDLRRKYKPRLRNVIDLTLKRKGAADLNTFMEAMKQEQVSVVLRKNDNGRIYGVTYVDHQSKCVFNGSELGKPYAANGLLEHCLSPENSFRPTLKDQEETAVAREVLQFSEDEPAQSVLDILTGKEYEGSVAAELRFDKKKRKRKFLRP